MLPTRSRVYGNESFSFCYPVRQLLELLDGQHGLGEELCSTLPPSTVLVQNVPEGAMLAATIAATTVPSTLAAFR